MLRRSISKISNRIPAQEAEAHCDAPCGVYDPASARIAAEAVVTLTRKALALERPEDDPQARKAYHNTLTRFIMIKEEQAEIAKRELMILWHDYFKPEHLKDYPDLHDKFWNAAKAASKAKQELNEDRAMALLSAVEEIHKIFWKTKGKDVPWITAAV
ncbi:MAG: superoxide dismutase, Ni [Candidatus Eisenbacteria bacterium]|nr:superoxide dismutase, Ni [Candidatus Eisenbacteria bacterium]